MHKSWFILAAFLAAATACGCKERRHGGEAKCVKVDLPLKRFREDKNYYFSTEKMTWAKAKEFCETYGMHLASPKTIEEIKGVRSLALRMGTKYYYWWVSPSNVGQSSPGDFRWHDMTKLPIDSPLWSNSQPNDYFGTAESTCGYFHSDADLQPFLERLLDGPCTKSNNFVCEVPAKCLYLNI